MVWPLFGVSDKQVADFVKSEADNYPIYAFMLGVSLLTLPLSYGHLVRAGIFGANLGMRIVSQHPDTTREAVRGIGNALQDIELPSPYMTPLWRN